MRKFKFISVIAFFFFQTGFSQTAWMPLFNGRDLEGWYSYLPSKGRNNDVENVFQVENGLLHISGKEFGYICTEKSFRDFHLVVEFRWGQKKWPPREADSIKRDNGILFNVPVGIQDRVWVRSVECQIQEGDVGDFWLVDSATIISRGKRTIPKDYLRIKKTADYEKPLGEWNRVEVISDRGKITFLVNGKKVNRGKDPHPAEGRIIIQSEGAEIFYRKIDIRELNVK